MLMDLLMFFPGFFYVSCKSKASRFICNTFFLYFLYYLLNPIAYIIKRKEAELKKLKFNLFNFLLIFYKSQAFKV